MRTSTRSSRRGKEKATTSTDHATFAAVGLESLKKVKKTKARTKARTKTETNVPNTTSGSAVTLYCNVCVCVVISVLDLGLYVCVAGRLPLGYCTFIAAASGSN